MLLDQELSQELLELSRKGRIERLAVAQEEIIAQCQAELKQLEALLARLEALKV